MNDTKTNKGLLWLGFLLSLLILLLSNSLSWLDDSDYDWLLSTIPYKWQLTLLMMLILSLLFALVYTKIFSNGDIKNKPISKRESKRQEKELEQKREKIIKNLSADEKLLLVGYLKLQTKVCELSIDNGTALALENSGILYRPNAAGRVWNINNFVMNDWAWEYINKHKADLGINVP